MIKNRINVIILGAAGRDFHNFLVYFKNNPHYKVICFTAEQIPGIADRKFPASLAGRLYKKGIPIYQEKDLPTLIKKHKIDCCYLSYSDIKHVDVMHKASIVIAAGANFSLLGKNHTQIKSKKPIVAITAVRTGCGKSPVSRKVAEIFQSWGKKVVAIRHPMPYGDLVKQEVQRFASYKDLKKQKCTIEEREEYEPWIIKGIPIYAGVNYEKIIRKAEKEADIIIWDGGNNDMSFYKPDLLITLVDPHRPGHELLYHPGEANFRSAEIIIIAKIQTAKKQNVRAVMNNCKKFNPKAKIVKGVLELKVDNPQLIKNKRILVIEDGPTLTHGGMAYGAGTLVAKKYGGKICDVEPYAVGSIKNIYKKFAHLRNILPAMGYSKKQVKELQQTINKAKCDVVVDGTPVNLSKLLKINKPVVVVHYRFKSIGKPTLQTILKKFLK